MMMYYHVNYVRTVGGKYDTVKVDGITWYADDLRDSPLTLSHDDDDEEDSLPVPDLTEHKTWGALGKKDFWWQDKEDTEDMEDTNEKDLTYK